MSLHRCRLCLKLSRNKIHIFKDDFPKMIEILTGLRVDPNDDFPKSSCLDCANNVKIALKTKKQIIQSHKTLLEEFIAKCKELNYSDICAKLENNLLNKQNITGKSNTSSNLNLLEPKTNNSLDCGKATVTPTDKLQKVKNPVCLRTTRSHSKLNKTVDSVHKGTNKSSKDLSLKDKNSTEQPQDNTAPPNAINVASSIRVGLVDERDNCSEDSCGEPSSPMSDHVSDKDWRPDESEKTEHNKDHDTPVSKTVRPQEPKHSDGIFFVKKPNLSKSKTKKTFETVIRIKKKPKSRSPPTRVTCDVCKKEVQSYWLQKHMETHEYNPVTCEFCGLISKSATALRHHVFYYHRSSANEYMCDQCGRNFRSKYRLNLHKKKEHGGTKDFECTTCGKRFFERMHLKRHVDKTHKNIRPYVCDFCGKSFKSRNHIKIHERIHSKEAPYTCHMCGESFKMKLTLRTHLKGVHNVQEVQKVFCDICKRGFASDMALKAHVNSRIHETEKCQYCSDMFTREYMVNHLREVHDAERDTTEESILSIL